MLYVHAAVNIAFSVFNLVSGIRLGSVWFVSIAIYYFSLTCISLYHIRMEKLSKSDPTNCEAVQRKTYRNTGLMLLFTALTLSGIIVQVVRDNRSYTYSFYLLLAVAVFAFYKLITTILRVIKAKTERNPIFSAAAMTELSAAVIAMFTLQTAMLSAFSDTAVSSPNTLTGSAASIIVIVIAVIMIVHGVKMGGKPKK